MARMSHEARAQLEAFKAVRVKHPRLEEADDLISQAVEEHAGHSHLLVYGPSGVGKSTVTRHLVTRILAEESNRTVVPVIWVEARPGDYGTYARLDYYPQVLTALREHAAVKDRLMQVALTPRPGRKAIDATEALEQREAVEYALERLQVKAVVVDEAQNMMQVQAPLRPVDQLEWLKSMTNHTQVLYVKYNLNVRRRLMTLTNDSCGRIKKAELFIASVHEELSHGRDSLGVLPAG